jgi:hypothetical protein
MTTGKKRPRSEKSTTGKKTAAFGETDDGQKTPAFGETDDGQKIARVRRNLRWAKNVAGNAGG